MILSELSFIANMVDVIPDSVDQIGHGSFAVVFKARLKEVRIFLPRSRNLGRSKKQKDVFPSFCE